MYFLNKLRLSAKISLGFGIILLLSMVSIFFAYSGLNKNRDDFAQYSDIATESMLAGRIQANLLDSRIAFKNLVDMGDDSQQKVFEDRFNKMQGFINELKGGINNKEREKEVEHILSNASEYKDGFYQVLEYKKKRDDIYYNILSVKGPEMESRLSAIMESAYKNKDEIAAYGSAQALKHLLLARLHASKFFEKNDHKAAEIVNSEFSKLDEWLKYYQKSADSSKNKELTDIIFKDKEVYYNSFNEAVSVIENRNKVIKRLDQIGPEISKIAEDIKLSIINEQNTYAPKVKRNNDDSIKFMVILAALAAILSVFIIIGVMKVIVDPVRVVTNTFKDIADDGDTNLMVRLKVGSKDELGDMATHFNKFMEKLQRIMQQNKDQNWLKTGQAELSDKLRGEQDITSLAQNIITYTAKYLNAQIGAIYVKTEDNILKMLGSYAYSRRKNISSEIKSGEGLVGQAVLEKQAIVVTSVPDDYIKVSSGVGEAVPRNILMSPCIYNDEVRCVIELGSFHEFNDIQMELMRIIGETIAISISTAEDRAKMKELLNKTLQQAQKLQIQQEELRQNNEELAEQTKALRESEARLQTQQEELRQSNEELEEQTRALKESEANLQAQQEELRVINEELEERTRSLERQRNEISVKNHNLKLAQREIEEKAGALEVASKYKSEFLANVSHELRTPLNSILALSQLLAAKADTSPLTEKQLEFARTIHSSGKDLLNLINDILDLSKVEAGKMDINIENMHFSGLTDYVQRAFEPIAEEKGLRLTVNIEDDLPQYMVTDAQRVQQIVNNLLSNAFKFTHQGEVRLEIGRPQKNDLKNPTIDCKNSIAFTVSDTGIGIPKDKQSVIFEAFKQSDGTTSRKYGGTGLGLSISREFARLMGGTIHLQSEEGKGSTFTLILPEKITEFAVFEQAAAAKEHEITDGRCNACGIVVPVVEVQQQADFDESIYKNGKTLLIIEDDRHFSNVLSDLALEKGYRSIIAQDGEKGVQIAAEVNPSAILLDIGLPGINGWEVLERLRQNPATANIPVHIISGGENKKDPKGNAAIVGYLKKPVSIEKFEEAMRSIENAAKKPFKKLLVLDSDKSHRDSIEQIIGNKEIVITTVETGQEAYELLKSQDFDCMILDISIKDMSGFELLERLREENVLKIPLIVHTDKELTQDEEGRLQKYAESIIIKGSRSMERLTAEASLFLHGIDSRIPEKKQRIIRTNLEKEESLKGKKILIVDDDMRNVFALSSVLEEKEIKVVVGRNGIEGIQKLKENSDIDLALMDIMMPEMDGCTAMREIRKDPRFYKVPIIALTAKAMKEDKNKCIEAGASDYLTKPIDNEKLFSLLRVWLYR